jgi:GNAT superfamily N-acetyltransferase
VQIEIASEPVRTSAALAMIYAAQDELDRRYEFVDADPQLDLEQFTPPRGAFLVAREDRNLAGGVGVRVVGEPPGAIGEIKRLWTRPDLRRQGVGRALMTAAVGAARELRVTTLYLETGYAQPEALVFYREIGWREVDRFPPGIGHHRNSTKFALDL